MTSRVNQPSKSSKSVKVLLCKSPEVKKKYYSRALPKFSDNLQSSKRRSSSERRPLPEAPDSQEGCIYPEHGTSVREEKLNRSLPVLTESTLENEENNRESIHAYTYSENQYRHSSPPPQQNEQDEASLVLSDLSDVASYDSSSEDEQVEVEGSKEAPSAESSYNLPSMAFANSQHRLFLSSASVSTTGAQSLASTDEFSPVVMSLKDGAVTLSARPVGPMMRDGVCIPNYTTFAVSLLNETSVPVKISGGLILYRTSHPGVSLGEAHLFISSDGLATRACAVNVNVKFAQKWDYYTLLLHSLYDQ